MYTKASRICTSYRKGVLAFFISSNGSLRDIRPAAAKEVLVQA
jgi:hypothetical protein